MTLSVVEYLSGEIGNRFGGTKGEAKAAEFLANRMKEIGLEVEVQSFKFLGWKPTRGPSLKVIEPEERKLDTGLILYSDNTPEGGVKGKMVHVGTIYVVEGMFEWPKYAVVDEKGRHLAYVIAFFDGPTIALPLTRMGKLWGRAPYVLIGKKDHDLIKKWMDEGRTIRVNVDIAGEFLPNQTSQNVIGTLKGGSVPEEEIVVCAHYDSAFGSPGADDNASGVEAMLKVAENIAEKGLKKTVKFIAFGAEEYLMLGSSYYVETLKEKGELDKVKALVNLDMTGAGDTLTIASEPQQFDKLVRKVVQDSGLSKYVSTTPMKLCEDSDHWPFHINNIPSTIVLFWPYEHYHQATDSKEKVSEDTVNKTAKATQALVETLAYSI